ncbi:MAG: hypothetical protein II474_01150 [Firmicutes bacterium]|nr:hypothetical protein [Bacillota bacterium]
MKKWKKAAAMALSLCVLLVLLTGCMKIELDINVKSNGKADLCLLYAMADSAMDAGGDASLTPEDIEEYEKEGWTAEEYSQDGYTGVVLKKSDVDLSETEVMEGAEGSIRKEGSTYIVDFEPVSKEDQADFAETASWLKTMGGSFVVRVTLPVKPVSHNATSVSEDGKTLEWDVLSMDVTQPIHVEFKTSNPALIIGIAAAAAVVIALIFVAMKSRKQPAPEAFAPGETAGMPEEAPAIPKEAPVIPEEAPAIPEEVPAVPEETPVSTIPEEITLEETPEEGTL